jgi:hypothetical protein
MSSGRIAFVLARLNEKFGSDKTESIVIDDQLSIEHILPQQWIANWPLRDGARGLTESELRDADPNDPRLQTQSQPERQGGGECHGG